MKKYTMAAVHLWLPMKFIFIILTVVNVHCENDYLMKNILMKIKYIDIHLHFEQT